METTNLISIQQFCTYYKVPVTFIKALHEYELIEIVVTKHVNYLKITQLHYIEKMIRLHYDLNINLEGLDAIHNLLKQVNILKQEIAILNNKLRLYEDL